MQTEQVVRNPKKKWIVIGVIALIVLVAGINIAITLSKDQGSKEELEFVVAKEKELSNTKLISGEVVPVEGETFYFDPTKGKFKEVFVKEGQQIEKGQKLFSYDNPELSLQARQLEIDKKMTNIHYEQSKRKIQSLKNEIQKAKNTKMGKEVINPLEEQLQDLQFQQQTTELEIERNKLQSEDLLTKQNELVVVASTAGTVQKVDLESAKSTSQSFGAQGTPIIQITSKNPYQIQGTLSELQKALILPNQPIKVTSKAIANKTWKGKITYVSQFPISDGMGDMSADFSGQSMQNISYYSYKATLDSQEDLAPGYHVALQVKLSSKEMLVVPRSSIFKKGDTSYVYVLKGKKLHKQKVETGLGDGEQIEITKGLKAKDKVVRNPSKDVHDGMEVKGK